MSDIKEEPNNPEMMTVYQIKVSLRGISPMIWRRLLVTSETTLAELHEILQAVMNWSDECLHRFRIFGKDYCIPRLYGLEYHKDAREVRLSDFCFRSRESFVYTYDMMSFWEHDLRIERILAWEEGLSYPQCIAGARASPPEFLNGPEHYLRWLEARDSYQTMLQLHEDMALVARRFKEFMGGGEHPTREDKEFREAMNRIENRVDNEPQTFDRSELNAVLRKLKEPSCTSESKS